MLDVIYYDLDGVLADFVTPALALHDRLDLLEPGRWPKGRYSMEDALGISKEAFWRPIHNTGHIFWSLMPAYDWMFELLEVARAKAKRVAIISKPSEHPSSSFGKHIWINKYFGETFQDFSLTAMKADSARPGRLLIDDFDKNCDEWTAAGGEALLFPQQWNRGEGNINTILDKLKSL